MADKIPFVIKQFNKGWNTETISDSLPLGMSPDLQNVDLRASGSVRKTWGYAELGTEAEDIDNYRLMVIPDRNGTQWLLKKSGTKLKLYDPVTEEYNTIKIGLTELDVPAYEFFDTVLYYISKTDDAFTIDFTKLTTLNGAITSGDAVVTVVSDGTTAFASSGTFFVNSTEVTYTGKTADTFTGCTGTPTTVNGSVVIASPVAASSIPKGDITSIYAGRLMVGIGSSIYGSKLTDFTNFTVASAGTGDAFIKTIEATCKALRVFYDDSNNLRLEAFAADNKIYILDILDDATLGSTLVTSSRFKEGVTALNQFSTVVGPNDLYHVDLNNQIRSLGQKYAQNGVNKIVSDTISMFHESLFKDDYHFEEAKGVIFGDEYWLICRQGDGDINNRLVIYNFTEQSWRLRTNVNASDIVFYNNKIVFASASDNKIFQFDESLMADNDGSLYFRYATMDIDLEPLKFERVRRVRVAGFISTNCQVEVDILRDFASQKIGEFTLDGSNNNIVGSLLGRAGSYGSVIFGGEVFGGESLQNIRFFVADLELTNLPDLINFRILFQNSQQNTYFELTTIKPIVIPMDEEYFPQNYILNTN